EDTVGIWAKMDYLVHVVSGKKTWHTTNGSWTAEAGQTLFFKKGAAIIEQFFDEDFCLLLFFIPDDFVKDIIRELAGDLSRKTAPLDTRKSAIRVNDDIALSAYFQSMMTYFSGTARPSEPLLRLKLKELIVSILLSPNNPELSTYFRSLLNRDVPSLVDTMEANFRYNLSLEDFAELCHRSRSSFKRDFRKHFNEAPGRWLLKKRLDYATILLRNADMNISQVAFECGFEGLAHFSRSFKKQFNVSPSNYRKELS
ncbi:MAG: helix-turn-helix domain-containing protein, partial [Phycisphaerae bacterium]|nr:helix-turn-helix transcriptional regulator [candidate division KSB1 bacterium]NIV00514.1 helix-turn-helix domain-containing protein [Phycisphaerae bacterium]NIR72951.1 helix-turn-helix transcriptional regulator [candidate division KSB1 bacterium]NIS24623.1 helix-turn-helix transcriptional regulator [candidate division KSB1 bacterium]NIT71525.1 helix-turn-helix transcriptional regulator [candidate division KSB1 bacterium]